jgi:hypothetical protein
MPVLRVASLISPWSKVRFTTGNANAREEMLINETFNIVSRKIFNAFSAKPLEGSVLVSI